ncbi:TetR/AcrR family transcriptional regulator C-terminal domain-containing protein [Gordonia sp. VNK21]|uniref:TetR/AcrR family transcriptional regulator C-terminal domain-containing protein n=1 Tax=Gordonia sp. VNK21 TaxID=3382483 RepID=UPI0038D3D5A6
MGQEGQGAAEPQVAVLLLTRPIRTMTGLTLTDDALGVLRTAGFGPDEAVFAFRSVFAFLVGTVLREASIGPTFADRNLGGIHERIGEIDAAGLHNVMESAEALSIVDHDQEFEFGLDVLVRGLERRLATGG